MLTGDCRLGEGCSKENIKQSAEARHLYLNMYVCICRVCGSRGARGLVVLSYHLILYHTLVIYFVSISIHKSFSRCNPKSLRNCLLMHHVDCSLHCIISLLLLDQSGKRSSFTNFFSLRTIYANSYQGRGGRGS